MPAIAHLQRCRCSSTSNSPPRCWLAAVPTPAPVRFARRARAPSFEVAPSRRCSASRWARTSPTNTRCSMETESFFDNAPRRAAFDSTTTAVIPRLQLVAYRHGGAHPAGDRTPRLKATARSAPSHARARHHEVADRRSTRRAGDRRPAGRQLVLTVGSSSQERASRPWFGGLHGRHGLRPAPGRDRTSPRSRLVHRWSPYVRTLLECLHATRRGSSCGPPPTTSLAGAKRRPRLRHNALRLDRRQCSKSFGVTRRIASADPAKKHGAIAALGRHQAVCAHPVSPRSDRAGYLANNESVARTVLFMRSSRTRPRPRG